MEKNLKKSKLSFRVFQKNSHTTVSQYFWNSPLIIRYLAGILRQGRVFIDLAEFEAKSVLHTWQGSSSSTVSLVGNLQRRLGCPATKHHKQKDAKITIANMEGAEIIQKIEQVQYSEGFLKHESMINSEKIKYEKKIPSLKD